MLLPLNPKMAAPGFSINDLIDASLQVKKVYDAFYSKNASAAIQVTELYDEFSRFAQNLERNRAVFKRAGLDYDDYGSIYKTLVKFDDFFNKYKAVFETTHTPAKIWRTSRFPYAKDDVQKLREALRDHKTDLIQRTILHIL